jgi:hypothetical protein
LGEDAEHRWIGVGQPSPEDESADKYDDAREEALE